MTATTTAAATSVPAKNPHRIPTRITGWAVPIIFVGALWGAGHDPDNSAWSAFAIIAIIAVYLVNKIRSLAWERRNRGNQ